MELIFLGTGTSTGVPMLGCHCGTCTSKDSADHRLRASVIIRHDESTPGLLIDAGPDLRRQLLTWDTPELAAVLITHIHYDHVGGIDDLRPYCYRSPDGRFPVYCREDVAAGLRHNFPYAFAEHRYPGAPGFNIHTVSGGKPFDVEYKGSTLYRVTPLEVMHGKLPIFGFRIGPLAYITDASAINSSTKALLKGVDTLVINALRPEPHPAHFSLAEALDVISAIKPSRAYLTHASHDMPPAAQIQPLLPAGVFLARDNMRITLE